MIDTVAKSNLQEQWVHFILYFQVTVHHDGVREELKTRTLGQDCLLSYIASSDQ